VAEGIHNGDRTFCPPTGVGLVLFYHNPDISCHTSYQLHAAFTRLAIRRSDDRLGSAGPDGRKPAGESPLPHDPVSPVRGLLRTLLGKKEHLLREHRRWTNDCPIPQVPQESANGLLLPTESSNWRDVGYSAPLIPNTYTSFQNRSRKPK